MMYKNVTLKKRLDDDLVPISFSPNPNFTNIDQEVFYIEPPPDVKGEYPAPKTNRSWFMQYHRMEKSLCVQKCKEIDHEIPSIDFIEDQKLENVHEETDFYTIIYCY